MNVNEAVTLIALQMATFGQTPRKLRCPVKQEKAKISDFTPCHLKKCSLYHHKDFNLWAPIMVFGPVHMQCILFVHILIIGNRNKTNYPTVLLIFFFIPSSIWPWDTLLQLLSSISSLIFSLEIYGYSFQQSYISDINKNMRYSK